MKITDTTGHYSDRFIKKLIQFCCKTLGMPANWITRVDFRGRTDGYVCGRAWWGGRILIRFDKTNNGPHHWTRRVVDVQCPDLISTIVFVAAHECQHVMNYNDGSHNKLTKARDLEPHCDRRGKFVMLKFLEKREALLKEWTGEPTILQETVVVEEVKPEPSPKLLKAQADLARWQKKLKLAKTKVKKYERKLKYHQKKAKAQDA